MLKFLRRAHLFVILAGAGFVACSGASSPTAPLADTGSGAVELRLRNSGSSTLTNISVLVADNAPIITSSELRAGQTTAYVARAKAHQDPVVTLKIDGQDYLSNPVEGFSGFNLQLADGKYTISIEPYVSEGHKGIYVRVTKD